VRPEHKYVTWVLEQNGDPHFLFELCVSGHMIEPTPVFMRL
jgi:hypothetical protein